MNNREEILSKVSSVESIPSSKMELLRLLQDPDVNTSKLASSIEFDPGFTTNLLRLANSVYFGCPKAISTVNEAINRLGTRNIFKLAVTSVAAPVVKKEVKGYDLASGEMLKHSAAVAVGAEKLAQSLNIQAPEHTFTAGLLHDIGKVVLGSFVEVDAETILQLAIEEQVSFEEAEQRILGIDHAELGAILLESWNLPPSVVDVVRWHHEPFKCTSSDTLVLDLVHVADALSMMSGLGLGNDGLNYRPCSEIMDKMNISNNTVEIVISEILLGLEELSDLFKFSDNG